MDFKQRYAIKRNFQYLLQECAIGTLIDSLLDRLFSGDLLERDEYEILIRMTLAKEKMRSLLSFMLDKRGHKYRALYDTFLQGMGEDLDRSDIIKKLSRTFEEAPAPESDTQSILSEDFRLSMLSIESGHLPFHTTTYNYNYFYSCPAIPEMAPYTPGSGSSTNAIGDPKRKLSLDMSVLPTTESISLARPLENNYSGLAQVSWREDSVKDSQAKTERQLSKTDQSQTDKREKRDFDYRVVIVGAPRVGKSSLILPFVSDNADVTAMRPKETEFERFMTIDEQAIKLRIFDVNASLHQYVVTSQLKEADGVIMVYDVTNMESLLSLISWHDMTKRYISDEAVFLMAANKCDLPNRQVSHDHGKMMAAHLGIEVFIDTCIAKDNKVPDLAADIARLILNRNSVETKFTSKHGKLRRRKRQYKPNCEVM